MWKFWERKTEGAGYATQPGGASNGPRGAVVCRGRGGDDDGVCHVERRGRHGADQKSIEGCHEDAT